MERKFYPCLSQLESGDIVASGTAGEKFVLSNANLGCKLVM